MRDNLKWGMMLLPETCTGFMDRHYKSFTLAQGSKELHQAWLGGYLDHLDEIFGIAALLYWSFSDFRKLPFQLEDVILVLWLHDLEKVWKRSRFRTEYRYLARRDKHALTVKVVRECNLTLTDEHWNALKYVHGEGDDYTGTERVSGPLGAFCHMCDYWSARGWFDEPKRSGQLRRLI